MNTFTYRDSRLPQVEAALAALPPELEALRAPLARERDVLQSADWRVTDRTYLAVATDILWPIRLTLLMQVESDPVLAALNQPPALTAAQAGAVETLPHGPGGPPADYLDQVRAAVGDDEVAFTVLVHTGHRLWLDLAADAAYPFDDVAVLLPLRLETLFDEPGSRFNDSPTQWQLSLRVSPDEASICRDNPFVSDGEQQALTLFWQAVRQPGDVDPAWLDGDAAAIAWQQLCARVAPPRAAWLVGSLAVQIDGENVLLTLPEAMPAGAQPNRVGGLPPELYLVAVTNTLVDGQREHLIGRLPQDPAAFIDNTRLTLPLPGAIGDEQDSWWASWETAQAVGLGGTWRLPAGMTPQNIAALYVTGLGDEPPDAHFKAQVDAGEMGVLPLGAPTNSVHGAATAGGGQNPANWQRVAQMRLRQRLGLGAPLDAGQSIQHHLLGREGSLPFFAGADLADTTQDSQRMVRALWPALWGHWLHDLWQSGDDAHRAANWAIDNLCPEGPLMPLRIGDQPYGLLPATALSQWQPILPAHADGAAQSQLEAAMAQTLTALRGRWADAARGTRSIVDQDTEQFMRLLGQDALSRSYIWRAFAPAWAQFTPYLADPGLTPAQRVQLQARFEEEIRTVNLTALDYFGREPDTAYLANGFWQGSRLPLVQPRRMLYRHRQGEERERVLLTRFLMLLYEMDPGAPIEEFDLDRIFQRWWVLDEQGEFQLGGLPNSLLIRLLVYASQLAALWRRTPSGSRAERRMFKGQQEGALTLAELLDNPAWQVDDYDPVRDRRIFSLQIPDEQRAQLERALRATLDSAAQRIDPWVTGFAWQRLRQYSSSPRRASRLGAYGWVDGPFAGRPGPTAAGRLHTPSYNQTLAALVLRDKFLSSTRAGLANDGGRNPWEMNITASKARLAEAIAEEVRLGCHIYEITGRYVENIVGAHQAVKELRTSDRYAMRPERKDPHEVCNGFEALQGLLAGDAAFPLNADQQAALRLLHDALDTYGDLLMADGVMQLVNRQAERAAETMDAAAGFAQPPGFEFLRTPPSGYQLESVVLAALPFVPAETLPAGATPARLADPSVAAFLDGALGQGWQWTAVNADDEALLGVVDLATLGLAPVDTLALSDQFLRDLARQVLGLPLVTVSQGSNRVWLVEEGLGNPPGRVSLADLSLTVAALAALDDATLHDHIRARLGAPAGAEVTEIMPDDPRMWRVHDEHGGLRGMADLVTLGLTPAAADALPEPALQRQVRQQLGLPQVRIDPPRQHQLAQQLTAALGSRPAAGRDFADEAADNLIRAELADRYGRLRAAGQQTIDDLLNAADDDQRRAALRRALAWGVTPVSEPAQRDAFLAALSGSVPPPDAAPLADLVTQVAEALTQRLAAVPAAPDSIPSLAQALAELAAPQGKLAILARWPQAALRTVTQLVVDQPEPALDEAWLTVVAAARAPLARLEALQLEAAPLQSWSSAPGDPWQQAQVQANLAGRAASLMDLTMPRFVAAYGPAGVWASEDIAAGLIDAFSEAIPLPQRQTTTAFGFNAPAARAPQAILLAVPPRPRQRLDNDLLWRIVAETRELAHARAARVEDLGELQALVPTMWLQATGPIRVRLEARSLYER